MFIIRLFIYVAIIYSSFFCKNLLAVNYLDRSFYDKATLEIPRILDQYDMDTYYNMYLYSKTGNVRQINTLTNKLHNKVLVPYILYMMYSSDKYRTSYSELKQWLIKYSDTAVARFVINDISRRYPQKIKEIGSITATSFYDKFLPVYLRHDYYSNLSPIIDLSSITSNTLLVAENKYTKQILRYIKKGYNTAAEKLMLSSPFKKNLNKYTYAYYANVLSKTFFLSGKDSLALKWGKIAVKDFKKEIPEASFTLGMVYYRLGDYEAAISYFKFLGNNNFDPSISSKGLYWEAKASLSLGDINNYYRNLKIASKYIYDFYGLLALEELGVKHNYKSSNAEIDSLVLNLLVKYPEGRRALSLLQFGFVEWAEQELIALASVKVIGSFKGSDKEKRIVEALLYMAKNAHMPALAIKLAGLNGKYYGLVDLAYPINLVDLEKGYEVDPSLVLAIMKKESRFYPRAKSSAGAVGLMQVLPSTAEHIIEKYSLDYKTDEYYIPKVNVDLGQKYISMLINNSQSGGNLIYVIAGYNAGFANVDKWRKEEFRMQNDPSFFIESIPFRETREYVKEVLSNYWVYQSILGVEPYTLNLIAQDDQPYYYDIDKEKIAHIIKNNLAR